jgi:hypothetical protein
VSFDPLTHPVAITTRSVIGDEIRVPVAWCDMAGCGAAFADPAALGEADNRARAVVAGWTMDALGRLVCSVCRQHHHAAPVWWVFSRDPGVIDDHRDDHRVANGSALPDGGPGRPGSQGNPGSAVQSAVASLPAALGQGRHQRGTQRPRLLAALASGRNGQPAPHQVAGP